MPGQKSKQPRINVFMADAELEALRRYCKAIERGQSWVIRMALRQMGVFNQGQDANEPDSRGDA